MSESSEPITIVIADDHPIARDGIRKTLAMAPDFKIIGEAEDGEQVITLVDQLHPQVLLLDLVMPKVTRPADIERWVREKYPDIVTLVLTAHDHDAYLADMMEAGVSGYFEKSVRSERLIAAIRRAARGELLFDENQLNRAREWRMNVKERWESLSEREREILRFLGEGMESKLIAKKLAIAPKTVEKHLISLYAKLGKHSRTEAALWWERNGRDFPH